MSEAAALIVLELALAAALQKIVTDRKLTKDEMQVRCSNKIKECFNKANGSGKRLLFGPSLDQIEAFNELCNSVCVEELHDSYFRECNVMRTMTYVDKGVLLVVYGRKGMGKTYACRSLLAMKHSRAPRHGYFFSGATTYPSGNDYFNSLLDNCLGRNTHPFLSSKNLLQPRALADMIISSLPNGEPAEEDNPTGEGRPGFIDIPGLREYFQSQTDRLPGGRPVVVFDDVNISVDVPNPIPAEWSNTETMKDALFRLLGDAAVFFDMVMTVANHRGVVVVVSTSNLWVAKFLHYLNDETKARAFKPLTDPDKFTCQYFGWSEQKRLEFLRRRATLKGLEIRDSILQAQAHDAFLANDSIREMDAGLADAVGVIQISASEETVNQGLCGACIVS